jgi:hypothetical protein
MAYGLIKDTESYHIHVWSSSNSIIKKRYDGYIVPPVIVAGGLRTKFSHSEWCCDAYRGGKSWRNFSVVLPKFGSTTDENFEGTTSKAGRATL